MSRRKEVLTVYVTITGIEEIKGKTGEALMIHFDGTSHSELFKGRIMPGAVDTQKEWYGNKRSLSARYILEGVDASGRECRIFIENNALIEKEGLITTVPKILTDSEELSWLETAVLTGTIEPAAEGVTIHIWCEG